MGSDLILPPEPRPSMIEAINTWRDAYPLPEPKVYVSRANYERLLARAIEAGHTEEQLAGIVEVLPEAPMPAHPRRGGRVLLA